MPDWMDQVQDRMLSEADAIVAAHAARTRAHAGRDTCLECGDAIAAARTADGATRCVECQSAEDHRIAVLYGRCA